MEDGVPEIQSFEAEHYETKDQEDEEEEPKAGGLLNNLIANFRAPGGKENEKFKGEEEEEEEKGELRGEMRQGDEKEKEGGILKHIISSVVSPLTCSPENKHVTGQKQIDGSVESEVKEEEKGKLAYEDDGREKRTQIKHQISSGDQAQSEGGGSSIIDNIVSHLATPLLASADNVGAPETDEASILIHSIVHD